MAVLRCEELNAPQEREGGEFKYCFVADPVDFPNPRVICRIKRCRRPAKAWLGFIEANHYQIGIRNFRVFGDGAQIVSVQDGGSFRPETRSAAVPKEE
jgi:hypothetical protein